MSADEDLEPGSKLVLSRDALARLFALLREDGRTLVGPVLRDGAIVHAEIGGIEDLPVGWGDEQDGGSYRLVRRDDESLFGYSVGPQSWKPTFFAPRQRLWQARRDGEALSFAAEPPAAERLALIGARSCDLHAIAVQDRVFTGGAHVDPHYAARRADVFVVAVSCGQAGGTCFCASMATGPRATQGFDLALTEIAAEAKGTYRYVVEVGSERGVAMAARLGAALASESELAAAAQAVERATRSMGRRLDTAGIRELFAASHEHPRWDDVAERCLACANCTMVCPTCFCSTVEDTSDLSGEHAERWRRWDSCFTLDFSYLHGGSVRSSTRSRYRQWLTHKLATWIDQFGTSGCVGCGRCVTWCPVGIDLTVEVAALRAGTPAAGSAPGEEGVDGDA